MRPNEVITLYGIAANTLSGITQSIYENLLNPISDVFGEIEYPEEMEYFEGIGNLNYDSKRHPAGGVHVTVKHLLFLKCLA